MVVEAIYNSINRLLAPIHKISELVTMKTLAVPTVPVTPEEAQKITVDSFNALLKMIADPATDPVNAALLKFISLFAMLPFTLGSAASILAQKNILIPLAQAVRPGLLEKGEAIEGQFTGVLKPSETRDTLQKLGYEDKDIDTILKLAEYIPSAQDVITFAVREVFTPTTVAAFGQLEGFDDIWKIAEKYVTAAKMSKETFSQFWAAHWELPSINQAYEMLHRGFIKGVDLDRLLVAADVMPFWREKLKSISYQVLTRVDVRRMHKLGVLTEAGVLKAYQDIGYDAVNAKLLTDFTIKYNEDPENAEETGADRARHAARDLTKAEILNAYSDKLLSKEDTAAELYYMGYSPSESAQVLALADYKAALALVKSSLAAYRDGYLAGAYTEQEVYALLGKLSLPAAYTEDKVLAWKLEKAAKVEMPSKAEYIAFYKAGTITENDAREGLTALGFRRKHIDWYLKPVKAKAA